MRRAASLLSALPPGVSSTVESGTSVLISGVSLSPHGLARAVVGLYLRSAAVCTALDSRLAPLGFTLGACSGSRLRLVSPKFSRAPRRFVPLVGPFLVEADGYRRLPGDGIRDGGGISGQPWGLRCPVAGLWCRLCALSSANAAAPEKALSVIASTSTQDRSFK